MTDNLRSHGIEIIQGGVKSAHEHGGAKSAHEHGQGVELGPPYSKGVLIQGLDTATVLI
ncbi:hypothetical protein J6590_019661 [Homalodisca vitripennis]|nr:hypothetical protein J6590_019661 [Homalodisca vitripennis]